MTDVLVLEPGDKIQVVYFSIVRNSDYVGNGSDADRSDPAEQLKPVISVRPFAVDTRYEFTEWIVAHLPKS